ncbi:MAG TPA: nuclear transport factor 2 family protein [Burkholderiales bacterium]|nr:nuclear transport factor 2 family protein [Burkholderiales bacterium]
MTAVSERQKLSGAVARLEPFAGNWHVEGEVQKSAYGPASRWVSDECCEWLPGHRFLINRWDARVSERDFHGMAVFGHDAERGYFARFHDNAGTAPDYRVSIEGSTWTLTGEAQRAVYEFGSGTIDIRWEWRDDKGWHPLCTLSARRVVSASQLVHDYFDAFQAQDRAAAERLLAQDFRFSSPRDDHIDRAAYFERCWPNSDKLRAFRMERMCEHDGEVFVRYSAERVADGVRFRNTEVIRVARGQIRQVEVYFGRDL